MSTKEDRQCPPQLLQLKKIRNREAFTLKSMLERTEKKLALASAGEELPRRDVTAVGGGQEGIPYYLLQPKAKAAEPPYLSPGEFIVLRDQSGVWFTARLKKSHPPYKNYSYNWGYLVDPADEDDAGDADEHKAYLHPGEDWGVLRGLDTNIDVARIRPRVPAGPQIPHILTTACNTCNGGEVKVFQEESAHLQQQLLVGFNCYHGRRITAIQPGVSSEGPFLPTPRPGYPMLPASVPGPEATLLLAAASTVVSTVTGPKVEARCQQLEEQLLSVVHAHADLVDAISNCNIGEISGYKELEEDEMKSYLKPRQDAVEELKHRAEAVVESLTRLADVEEDVVAAEQQEARQGEVARVEEVARQLEATRQLKATRQLEVARQLEAARQVEAARQLEAARQVEADRQLDAARQIEAARQQEAARRQEQPGGQEALARQEQLAREQEVTRQEQLAREQVTRQEKLAREQEAARRRQEQLLGSQEALASPPYLSDYASRLSHGSREQLPPPLSSSTSRAPLQAEELLRQLPPAILHHSPPPHGAPLAPATPQRRGEHVEFYQQTISPHSRQALKLINTRMNKDRDALDETISKNEKEGVTKYKANIVNSAITEVEKQIGEILATYSQQLRAAAYSPSSRQALDRDRLHEKYYDWLRQARSRNWAAVVEAEVQCAPQAGAAYMERVKFPNFDGQPENWADFRRKFKELIKVANYKPVLEMSILVDHLSEDAARYVLGVSEPAKAWAVLEKRYGDRTLAIITARHRLLNLKVPKGPAHDQVEAVEQGLNQARSCLEAVQAEAELFSDISTVGHLLAKLPHTVQQVWYRHRATFPTTCSASENGRIFEEWLSKEGDAAMHQRLTILTTEISRPPAPAIQPLPCGKCGRLGHGTNTCRSGGGGVSGGGGGTEPPLRDQPAGGRRAENFSITGTRQRFDSKEQAEVAAASATARRDPCPACQGAHTYLRNLGTFSVTWPSNRLEPCPEFAKMSSSQRATMVEAQGGCCLCTAATHKADQCWQKSSRGGIIPCSVPVGGKPCGRPHHPLLHGSSSVYCQAMTTTSSSSQAQPSSQAPSMPGAGSLFGLQEVPVASPCGTHTATALMLEDSGSTDNFVTHELAARLSLPSTPTSLFIRVLDEQYREKPTMVYLIDVVDRHGAIHKIEAIGMNSITSVAACPEVHSLARLFPEAPPEAAAAFQRPHGVVSLMLGMRDRRLHSTDGLEHQDLRLCRSRFASGWVLTGFSPLLATPSPDFSSEVLVASLAAPPPNRPVQSFFLSARSGPSMDFMEAEELGVRPAPACSSCKGCGECSVRRKVLTSHEAEVVARIEREMSRDPDTGTITASYPWKPCKERMKENRNQVEKIQRRIETSMRRDGTFQDYQEEMEKALASGAVRELTSDELLEWRGPAHFLTLFPVLKASSVSTKLRIVSNSALVNAVSGLSLNDCLWAGPNALAELLGVLVHWRTVEVALLTDIVKAYHVIHTRQEELHMRRFLHREAPTLPWRVYAHTRATFGDLPAGLMLELVKRRAAELGMEEDPLAAQQIKDNSYVDDCILGGDKEEVGKMKGHLLPNGKYSGTVTRILAKCGMTPKFLAVSGDQDPAAAEPLGGKVLGLGYHLGADNISFKLELKFFQKFKGKKEAKTLTMAELEAIRGGTKALSRRTTLSLLQGWFDPLGLLSPALLKGKQLLRRLHNPSLGWDDEIPAAERLAWADWLQELATSEEVTFPRSTTPPGHRGAPSIAAFADSSLGAYCAAVYVVWEVEGGSFSSRLLIAKCRLTALRGTTIPRGELCAVVVMMRLAVLASLHLATPIHRITCSTDSECVIAALAKSGSSFAPYWQNRVSEITGLLEELAPRCDLLEPVTHVPSAQNPADIGTRGTVSLADLGPGSVWQQGPAFLASPRDAWPLQVLTKTKATVVATSHVTATELAPSSAPSSAPSAGRLPGQRIRELVLTCLGSRDLATSTRLLARVLRALFTGDRSAILTTPSPRDVAAARHLQLLASSPSAFLALGAGKLLSLGAQESCGLVVITGRVGQAHLARLLGTSSLPVVMPTELLALRVTEAAHREDHRLTVRDVTARVRRTVYVPGGNRLAKAVCNRCMVCRCNKRTLSKQIMGDLPLEKLSGAAPFVFTALDMFGPWKVRELAGGRRFLKCWGVMFCCLSTKAVCILACPGYDAATFGTTYRRFTSIYNDPTTVFTDHGPQILAHAGAGQDLSLREVAEEAGKRGTEWIFAPKACSWRNGQAEVCIRLARHTLSHLLASADPLDFHSLDATFLEVAAIMNRRPIAVRYASADDWHAISPSDVLLGRAHWRRPDLSDLPHLPQDLAIQRALSHQQEVVAAWREQWLAQALPEMIPRTAWKQEHRSAKVGDIGHIIYKSSLGKSAYRLCKIVTVSPDSHGVVRTCTVAFRPRHRAEKGQRYLAKEPLQMQIGVQRFAVLLPLELQTDGAFSLSPRRPQSSPSSPTLTQEAPDLRPEPTTPLATSISPQPRPLAPLAPLGAPVVSRAAPAGWQGGRAAAAPAAPLVAPTEAPALPVELQQDVTLSPSRRPSPQTSSHPFPLPLTQESPDLQLREPITPLATPTSPSPCRASPTAPPASPAAPPAPPALDAPGRSHRPWRKCRGKARICK